MNEIRIDDLEELWKAGAVNLQQVAGQFSQSAINLHKAGVSEESAFEGADPELTAAWARLRNMFQDKVLVTSYNNCTKSGNALANIAISLSKQDDENGEDLEKELNTIIKDTKNSDVEDDRPPYYVPEAPKHGDEHPREYPAGPGDFR